MNSNTPRSTVLVVDDEHSLADLYTQFLEGTYEVKTAYDGEQALEVMAEEIDVVLLDRRMPGLSGHEVLETIRDRGHNCRVAMVTAVTPDFDIVEMGFDDYLTKPADKSDLHDLIERLLELNDYDATLQEYYQLVSKKATLEVEKSEMELKGSNEYTDLTKSINKLETELEAKRDTVDIEDVNRLL